MYYHTLIPVNLAHSKQASKHFTGLFWPLVRPNASDPSRT